MKILKNVRKHYAYLGISSSNQSAQRRRFSKRVIAGFLFFGWSAVSRFVYIFYVASAFMEYVESICTTTANIIIFVCFAAIAFKTTLLFENIDKLEKLITSSKFSSIYKSLLIFVEIRFQNYFRM